MQTYPRKMPPQQGKEEEKSQDVSSISYKNKSRTDSSRWFASVENHKLM
jgi:hypothetical protein